MSTSTIGSTFIIMFRETLEAGLIVGIILSMLSRLQAMRYARIVWFSVAAAAGASALIGWGLSAAASATQDRWNELIEGVISLAACGVLTYMVFWMDRQAKHLRPQIEHDVERVVARQALPAMVALPFLAVFREGVESALFLNAVAMQSGTSVSVAGALLGSGLAVIVTGVIFIGGRRVPLRALFRSTGWLLLLIAAGLLAYGIHELQELGWLPTLVDHVWDINHIVNEKVGVGAFLKSLLGYNGNPSLLEVIAYVGYLIIVGGLLRRSAKSQPPSSQGPRAGLRVASASA